MEWDLREILTEVKCVCYRNVHTVERLLVYNSLAQNAAVKMVEKERKKQGYLFSLEELAAMQTFQLIRADLLQLSRVGEESRRKGFYQLRRRLIENIEALIRRETETNQETTLPTPRQAALPTWMAAPSLVS
jgi:hypothetical protein